MITVVYYLLRRKVGCPEPGKVHVFNLVYGIYDSVRTWPCTIAKYVCRHSTALVFTGSSEEQHISTSGAISGFSDVWQLCK